MGRRNFFRVFQKQVCERYLAIDWNVRNLSRTQFPFEFTVPDNGFKFLENDLVKFFHPAILT